MADSNPTTPAPAVEYHQCIWGDLIYGTMAQLQALGLGGGFSFPIEGSRRTLKVPDPRGFTATIRSEDYRGAGVFSASISLFDEYPRPEPIAKPFAPGVAKCEATWFDEYCGTAVALAACGVVELSQLPGQPGMRKTRVRILPDGSVLGGPLTATRAETRKAGAKEIERDGVGKFRVRTRVTAEEEQQRAERQRAAEDEWEWRIQSLPRPAPLNEKSAIVRARRAHLKLVWSAAQPINGNA